MIDVLIVDDHPVMRELLRQVLEKSSDVAILGEAVNGEEAVRQATCADVVADSKALHGRQYPVSLGPGKMVCRTPWRNFLAWVLLPV